MSAFTYFSFLLLLLLLLLILLVFVLLLFLGSSAELGLVCTIFTSPSSFLTVFAFVSVVSRLFHVPVFVSVVFVDRCSQSDRLSYT